MTIRQSLFLLLVFILLLSYSSTVISEVSESRQQELKEFVLEECTFCHGDKLEGDIGPPLMHYNLRLLPPEYIAKYIKVGRPGTKMRSWAGKFTEEELNWIVDWLRAEKLDHFQPSSRNFYGSAW